jgi:hypothetical protein
MRRTDIGAKEQDKANTSGDQKLMSASDYNFWVHQVFFLPRRKLDAKKRSLIEGKKYKTKYWGIV